MEKLIRKYVLQNAIRFEGKANPGNIIGKILGEDPSKKSKIKEIMAEIQKEVKQVNELSIEEQRQELQKLAPELLEEKKVVKKKELKPITTQDSVIFRFAPSPSGPLHIGHAYTLSLNSEYCRKYKGQLILRIEDTNPDNIFPFSYDAIPEDSQWVTNNNVTKIIIQSDRLETYYKHAEEVIKKDFAYICTCDAEEFKKLKNKGEACPCRNLSPKENTARWQKMFTEYQAGDAVMRIKTDITHPNPALRDWAAFRINESTHPRQKNKYRLWPLMNFSVLIDDHALRITHTIRAKDHIDNERKQEMLANKLGWKMPENIYVGRINFEDMKISTSKSRALIETKKYSGWEDIRLPFLRALKRRGFQPEAFISYALDVGVTANDKKCTSEEYFKILAHFNKEIIESIAQRFFFIKDPVDISIENAPSQDIELDLHPDNKKGGRKLKTTEMFYIEKSDFSELKNNNLYRLMDCLNFRKEKSKLLYDSREYERYKGTGKKIMHWLPKTKGLPEIEILMPDNTTIEGIAEPTVLMLKEGDIIQFERFGFCRLDKKEGNRLFFWFTHK